MRDKIRPTMEKCKRYEGDVPQQEDTRISRSTNSTLRWALIVVAALSLVLVVPRAGYGQTAADRFPGEVWMRFANVEEAGFDPALLEEARSTWERLPSSAFMVIADGTVVAAWGEVERRFWCYSLRKSFLSALYGIYWDRGEIELNQTLADLGIDDEPVPLLETEKQARILDLLKARSGVFHAAAYAGRTDTRPRASEGPGRYFAYQNWDFNISGTILMQETGEDIFEAFDHYFAQPLGMEDWRPSDGFYYYEREKSRHPAYAFRMSARDAARFGLLFARSGKWANETILSEHWVNRCSALYSIDNDVFGYGLYWWIAREPRFARHGMYTALGGANQMIAVLPGSDMVIVSRNNTYEGQGPQLRALLALIERILESRTGTPVANPALVPLEVDPDPGITEVPHERLTEFAGTWEYPWRDHPDHPEGTPRMGFQISVGEGYLVGYTPWGGTFKLYLQDDGTLHEEDSYARYYPLRDETGLLDGIADAGRLVEVAIAAASDGEPDRARVLLRVLEDEDSLRIRVGTVAVDLFSANSSSAEEAVGRLSELFGPDEVEREVNFLGYWLLGEGRAHRALELFELNTRVFPGAWNAWDSLGEAHLHLGNVEEALHAYERSLELNPDNETAERVIAGIRGKGRM